MSLLRISPTPPTLAAYTQFHRASLATPSPSTRYLYFVTWAGFANRVLALLSALVLAVLTDRVLLVDDVSDSGRTLAMVVQLLEAGGADLRTVVLYTKPGTVYEPTYTWKRTDKWINFPWSVLPVVTLD